nr:hypothetical protein [Bacillus pumilus]
MTLKGTVEVCPLVRGGRGAACSGFSSITSCTCSCFSCCSMTGSAGSVAVSSSALLVLLASFDDLLLFQLLPTIGLLADHAWRLAQLLQMPPLALLFGGLL